MVTLKPFQATGARFLAERRFALLADEPGLGKTCQAIAAAKIVDARRILVICPASVRLNWRHEIKGMAGEFALEHYWKIISYNEATRLSEVVRRDLLILDESHFLKNPDASRTQAVFGNANGIARNAKRVWCLTGTPMMNRPAELYPILKTLAADKIAPYDTWSKYAQRFCGAYFDGRAMDTRGATHLDDLAERLRGFMLRRRKVDVLPELPPKIVRAMPILISPEDRGLIDAEERQILDREIYLSPTHEKFSQLGDLARLLRVVGEAKVSAAAGFVMDLLETREKVVVFARHRDVIAHLYSRFLENRLLPAVLVGGMTDLEKDIAVRQFVEDPKCRVFIGNWQAAGVGINGLQKVSDCVVFAELPWVPAEVEQGSDRVHRMGLMEGATHVDVFLLHVPGTLESAVLSVQERKNKVIEKLLDDRLQEVW